MTKRSISSSTCLPCHEFLFKHQQIWIFQVEGSIDGRKVNDWENEADELCCTWDFEASLARNCWSSALSFALSWDRADASMSMDESILAEFDDVVLCFCGNLRSYRFINWIGPTKSRMYCGVVCMNLRSYGFSMLSLKELKMILKVLDVPISFPAPKSHDLPLLPWHDSLQDIQLFTNQSSYDVHDVCIVTSNLILSIFNWVREESLFNHCAYSCERGSNESNLRKRWGTGGS